MAVAAGHGQAGKDNGEFMRDDMSDAMMRIAQIKHPDPRSSAVPAQRLNKFPAREKTGLVAAR